MVRVLRACFTNNKGKTQVETINLESEFLTGWVAKSFKTMKSPRGEVLEPCSWHSGTCHSGDINNPSLCYMDPLPSCGIWLTNYEVYDTCHLREKEANKKNTEEIRLLDNMINELGSRVKKCEELHSSIKSNITKRNFLINEMTLLEKELAKDINLSSPEYIKLKDIERREETNLESIKKSLVSTYETLKTKELSLQEFIAKQTINEVNKLNKARDAVHSWYNSHSKKDKSDIEKKYYNNKSEISNINLLLQNSYVHPFSYLYRTYLNVLKVQDLMYKHKVKRSYTLENIQQDLRWFNENLSYYDEFLKNITRKVVMEKYEREQELLQANDKFLKNSNLIHRIKVKSNIKIIDVDGNVENKTIDEKIVIGVKNSSFEENKDDRWNNLR